MSGVSITDAMMIKIFATRSLPCKDKIFSWQDISNLSVFNFGTVQILCVPQCFLKILF